MADHEVVKVQWKRPAIIQITGLIIMESVANVPTMEQLRYVIEDSTIAEILGVQNFTNDESAVLELVKNAYDAKSTTISLDFFENNLIITDSGEGMSADDIKQHWMHVGKSPKACETVLTKKCWMKCAVF